jgi:hypothetical protein
MRRFLTLAVTAFVGLMIAGIGGSANTPATAPSRQDIAKRILDSKAVLTAPARAFMEMVARGDRRLVPDVTSADSSVASNAAGALKAALKAAAPARDQGEGLANVRVNNPAEDVNQTDQTTQSETSIAVSGRNVAVGFNDSQTALLALTAGADLSGFAYSTDGGKSFVDGGALPNVPGDNNFGDPWLASDSAGNMYYSNLVDAFSQASLFVGLSKSTDGGKTWSMANPIPPPVGAAPFGYSADKDALASGPGVGNLYDSWDDFTSTFDPITGIVTEFSGLPMAHSTDGGATWSTVYADQVPLFSFNAFTGAPVSCTNLQYIGAQPVAAPDGQTVYDLALRFGVIDPNCTQTQPFTENEWILISHDGGKTFTQKVEIADVLSSTGGFGGAFQLGPSQLMRNLELPTLALRNGNLYASWNDGSVLAAPAGGEAKPGGGPPPPPGGGGGSGHSHIAFSKSTDGGLTWSTPVGVTSGNNDEAQPAITADRSGIHDLYYEITPSPANDGTRVLDVFVSNSEDGGASWDATRVTSQSFPGVLTFLQFDPIIAFTYMGDYIANVSAGGNQYFAWGDNRDVVTNFLWPSGRHDPDVFFASSQ